MRLLRRALPVCACLLSCDSNERDLTQQPQNQELGKQPVTLVFRGSDTLGAKLVPQLAEEYRKKNPHVSFEIAGESGYAYSIDYTAQFLLDGGIIMASRQIKEGGKEHLEAKMLELSEFNRRTSRGR